MGHLGPLGGEKRYRFWCRELNDIVKSQIIVKYTQKKICSRLVDRNIEYIVVTRYRTKEF